jgi:hypothetical protein
MVDWPGTWISNVIGDPLDGLGKGSEMMMEVVVVAV